MTNSTKYILIAVAIIIIAAAGIYAATGSDNSQINNQSESTGAMESDSTDTEAMMSDDKMEDQTMDNEAMEKDDTTSQSNPSTRYQDYSENAVQTAQANGEKAVLFFHAKWCPTCKAADAAFNANLSSIPENVVVFKTDYDTQTELKNKFNITYQHTFVQIDNNGNKVSIWNGGDIANLKQYVQ